MASLAPEGPGYGEEVTPILTDTEHPSSRNLLLTGKSCLLYPRKPRTAQLFRVRPWSRLRSTAHFPLLLTQGGRALLLTGENHTHGFMQRQLMSAFLLACLRCGAGRTSLRRSPACCVNVHLEPKPGFAVIVDVLRKHFREARWKDTDEGRTTPKPAEGSCVTVNQV